jgi:Ca-activated chloride channel family protein
LNKKIFPWLLAVLFLATALSPANAQNLTIKAESKQIVIPITAFHLNGRIAEHIDASEVSISMDGVEQKIQGCYQYSGPASVVYVLDRSGSMAHNLVFVGKTVDAVIDESVDPLDDEFALEVFSSKPRFIMRFKSDKEAVPAIVAKNLKDSHGRTALYDAVYNAIAYLKRAASKDPIDRHYAIVVITDGGDNSGRYTRKELLAFLREADVPIFAIKASDYNLFRVMFPDKHGRMVLPKDTLGPDELKGPDNLQALADASGGAVFTAYAPEQIPRIGSVVNEAMRRGHFCAFTPEGVKRTKDNLHNIKLTIHRDDLQQPRYKRTVVYEPGPSGTQSAKAAQFEAHSAGEKR